ncbi:MAG: hypothetical protein Q4G04_07005, partial [bacterium]|nr:hypothetical protein [bacterium]
SGGMDLSECVLSGSTYVSQVDGVNHNFQDYTCSVDLGVVPSVSLDNSGANAPVLADGMIPIMWDGGKWVKADATNTNTTYQWYDYNNKLWANAVMLNPSQRVIYMNADPGYAITESHVFAYYVWIPRYRYTLFNVGTSTVSSQLIEVTFETADTQKSTGSTVGSQLTHPAFTWGTGDELQELDGIWVGKFETTGTTSFPTIKPSISPLVEQTVSGLYNANKVMDSTKYLTATGVSQIDVHMMKNTEWN